MKTLLIMPTNGVTQRMKTYNEHCIKLLKSGKVHVNI